MKSRMEQVYQSKIPNEAWGTTSVKLYESDNYQENSRPDYHGPHYIDEGIQHQRKSHEASEASSGKLHWPFHGERYRGFEIAPQPNAEQFLVRDKEHVGNHKEPDPSLDFESTHSVYNKQSSANPSFRQSDTMQRAEVLEAFENTNHHSAANDRHRTKGSLRCSLNGLNTKLKTARKIQKWWRSRHAPPKAATPPPTRTEAPQQVPSPSSTRTEAPPQQVQVNRNANVKFEVLPAKSEEPERLPRRRKRPARFNWSKVTTTPLAALNIL